MVRHDPHCLKVLGSSDCDTLAARYQMSLSKKYGLRAALAREHAAAERALRLAANVKGPGDGEG